MTTRGYFRDNKPTGWQACKPTIMEVKDKVININNAIQAPTQMNKRQPAAYGQGDLRHSAANSNKEVRHEPAALSVKALAVQIRRNDPAGIENANIENAINSIKDSLKNALISVEKHMNRGIRLAVENDIGTIIVKIIDRESGEVVRQIPCADAVELTKHLKTQLEETVKKQNGLFVDKEI